MNKQEWPWSTPMNSSYNYSNFGDLQAEGDTDNDYDYYTAVTTQNHDYKQTTSANNSFNSDLSPGTPGTDNID